MTMFNIIWVPDWTVGVGVVPVIIRVGPLLVWDIVIVGFLFVIGVPICLGLLNVSTFYNVAMELGECLPNWPEYSRLAAGLFVHNSPVPHRRSRMLGDILTRCRQKWSWRENSADRSWSFAVSEWYEVIKVGLCIEHCEDCISGVC